MTVSERILWQHLRGRRAGGEKWRRQHPVGALVLDFYHAGLHLALEVDGSVHDSPEQQERDQSRSEALALSGIRILRIRAGDVEGDSAAAIAWLEAQLG
jgi:very-short-patch-repair endonuclease